MLDIGWTEILVITVVALFIVGPKDIPKALRTVGIWIGKLKSLSREFQNTVEDAVRDSELDEVKKQIMRRWELILILVVQAFFKMHLMQIMGRN